MAHPGSLMGNPSRGRLGPTDFRALSGLNSDGSSCGQFWVPIQPVPDGPGPCSRPSECDVTTPIEVNMEACEENWMKDDDIVGNWAINGQVYYLRCSGYCHIYRQRFQETVTAWDRMDFRGCVGLVLTYGSMYKRAKGSGYECTNPNTGVRVRAPLK